MTSWRRKRPPVSRIEIDGNTTLSDGDIRSLMSIRSPGFWNTLGLRDKPILLVGAEERDEAAIRRAYRQKGYWSATASISAAPDPDDQRALVTVFVTEGERSWWGDVTLSGDDAELTSRGRGLLNELDRGSHADSLMMEFTAAQLRALCADHGRPRALIEFQLVTRRDTIDVSYSLRAGPEVRLGDLLVDGASRTKESVVRREANWEAGELYSQRKLAWRQQDVYATGLFTFVHLDPYLQDTVGPIDSSRADFLLRVVERKPSYVGFRTGAGQDPNRDLTWDYAFEWGSRNWMGTARQWSLTARSGFVVVTDWEVLHHRFAARFTEPWPFGVRLPTTLTLAYEPGVRSSVQDYRVERIEGEINVTRRIRRILRWWSSLVLERVNIYDIPPEELETYVDEKGISVRRRFRVALERDTRPNLFVPTTGARTRADLEYVGGILGGENDFYKVDLSWARYQTISAPTIFASRLRVGWVKTHSGAETVPTIDRFYLGGANSIRGYTENTVGPKVSTGAPAGGQVIILSNLELRTPMISNFWFTVFLDAGNNFERFRDMKVDDMLVSLGVGLQYIAPVGPLRLDYARRVVHPNYPRSDRVHLSILFSF